MMEENVNDPQAESTTEQPGDSTATASPESTTDDGGLIVTVTDSFGATGGDDGDDAGDGDGSN